MCLCVQDTGHLADAVGDNRRHPFVVGNLNQGDEVDIPGHRIGRPNALDIGDRSTCVVDAFGRDVDEAQSRNHVWRLVFPRAGQRMLLLTSTEETCDRRSGSRIARDHAASDGLE